MNIMELKEMSDISRPWIEQVMLGKRIMAITEYRRVTNSDLRTAKAFIDGFIDGAFHVATTQLIETSL